MSRRTLSGTVVAALLLFAANLPGADLSWSARSERSSFAKGKEYMILSGDANIRSGSMEIQAENIEASGKNLRYVYCSGSVKVNDSERGIRLQCENLFYDRELEISRVDGYTEMQDLTNEVVVKAGFFEYLAQEDLLILQIGVRILKVTDKTEITCRAEFAKYQRDKNLLELTGVPWVTRNEDKYSASRIVIDLDTEEISLEGGVTGTSVDSGDAQP